MKAYPLRTAGIYLMLLASLYLSACSGGGLTCQEACDRLFECGLEQDAEQCAQDCSEIKGVIRTSSWNDLGDCIMETECEVLNPDLCMEQVAANAPSAPLDNFINDICNKMVSCYPEYDHEQCVTQMQEEMGEDAWIFVLLKDSVLRCISDCVARAECAQLDQAMGDCAESCGLNF